MAIEISRHFQESSILPGDTIKFENITLGDYYFGFVENQYYDSDYDRLMFSSDFGELENLAAKLTFVTPQGNRCLIFEGGEPTSEHYPDIRLKSGYVYDESIIHDSDWPGVYIYTITDSLFEKATVCE